MDAPHKRGALVALVCLAGLAALFGTPRPRPTEPARPSPAPLAGGTQVKRPDPRREPAPKGGRGVGARPDEEGTPERRFLSRMDETRAALLTKHRYPPSSRPLAGKTDLLLPHHVEPTLRGLDPKASGKASRVTILQSQDRLYLMPGQGAVVAIKATLDDAPAPFSISRSDLVREAAEGRPSTVVGSVTLHDDGVAPDEVAADGIWTGTVAPPADGVASGLTLFVDAQSGGERGTLAFPFVQTASPPARFTETARSALEDGSVAFYVGVSVERAGLYEIVARVYDATGAPVALLRFLERLATDSVEVRLLTSGALLLDEGAVPPLSLRDVEGRRMLLGEYPDRELMEDWPAGFTTPAYDVGSFSDAEHDAAEKQVRLDALDKATREGLANLQGPGSRAPGTP